LLNVLGSRQLIESAQVACQHLGIVADELLEKNIQFFKGYEGQLAKLKMEDYEQRRLHKMRTLL